MPKEPLERAAPRKRFYTGAAPGGAGYGSRCFEEAELRGVLGKALRILSCDRCQDSCCDCLRPYTNQWLHARLNRLFVRDGLDRFNKKIGDGVVRRGAKRWIPRDGPARSPERREEILLRCRLLRRYNVDYNRRRGADVWQNDTYIG